MRPLHIIWLVLAVAACLSCGATTVFALDSIGAARGMADGTPVTVSGVVIYGSPGYKGGFVIESSDRSAGILVVSTTIPAAWSVVTVSGTVSTVRGERAIIEASVSTSYTGVVPPKPYVPGLSLLLSNTGLSPRCVLIRAAGMVADVGTGCIYINDGNISGRGVKVVYNASGVPPAGAVSATGIAIVDTEENTEPGGCVILASAVQATAMPYLGRTETQVQDRWNQLRPTAIGASYATIPSWFSPFAAGSLKNETQQDAINACNFVRYLAGVPDDLTGNTSWYEGQQCGSVLLKNLGYISHTPPQPTGMSDSFYQLAYGACSSSNIASGFTTPEDTVHAYMVDSGGNESTVGHRRWVLNPSMQQTAFGWCEGYSCMKSFDVSRAWTVSYDYAAWPAPGAFPKQFCTAGIPWSITLNTNVYSYTGTEAVTLKRLSDGQQWDFSASSVPTGGLFLVNRDGYGVPYCIIFRPATSVGYTTGDQFTVTLTGIKTKTGTSVSFSWTTTLFTLAM